MVGQHVADGRLVAGSMVERVVDLAVGAERALTAPRPPARGTVRAWLLQPSTQAVALSGGLVAFGLTLALSGGPWPSPVLGTTLELDWWMLGLMFAASELLVFHVELHRETHTFSFSEVPFVLGLCFASAPALLLGRVVGGVLVLLAQRQKPLKLVFNGSVFIAEVGIALAVFHALAGDASLTSGQLWFAAWVAILAADLVSALAVGLVIRCHGGPADFRMLGLIAVGTASFNSCLGIITVVASGESAAALLLIAILVLGACLGFRAFALLAQRYSSLKVLHDFTRALDDATRDGSLLDTVLFQARQLLRAEIAEINLVGAPSGGPRVCVVTRDGTRDELTEAPGIGEEITRWVLLDRAAMSIPQGRAKGLLADRLAELGVRDCVVARITAGGGVSGTLVVANRLGSVGTFSAEDSRLLETLARQAGVALENGHLIERLVREARERQHEAHHDALTGLPNRTFFRRELNEAIQRSTSRDYGFSVMLMDLDRFKEINDTLGHDSGDRLLEEIAQLLLTAIPRGARVARLGGDEFAVLVPGVADGETASEVARSIRNAVARPLTIDGMSLETGVSVGIAFWPTHGRDASTLLKSADVAMYAAKANPERVQVYDDRDDEHSLRRLTLGGALGRALQEEEISICHQPILRTSDGCTARVEILARWEHPSLGQVPPSEFIPLAEHSGVVGSLTRYVLERALEEYEQVCEAASFGLAVNLSVHNLLDADLAREVRGALDAAGVDPSLLTLEVTESGMLDPSRTVRALRRLADVGVRLSIDDFGTGYSSLSYLQRLPVQEVKIDQSFVARMTRDRGDRAIVQSIIDLAHNLGLEVVAEGVEDRKTWEGLVAAECDAAQGFYLSRHCVRGSLAVGS
jgi:diguanylate cyclase (GGDEF)-like protein